MKPDFAIVVTSISSPNLALRALAEGALRHGLKFVVTGDTKSPAEFNLDGCEFHSVEAQRRLPFRLAPLCPVKNYSRKNLGYLLAIAGGARVIVETDDDNIPRADFWRPREQTVTVPAVDRAGWVNVYRYFADGTIWPRGFPLELINGGPPPSPSGARAVNCAIQQGLADDNPDVDAVYRMTQPLPVVFKRDRLALGEGSWCPFNSQNTTFFREAFPLLYIPSCCTMRVSDIWRSFVAQRIAWANGWSLLFHEASVYQVRNEHNLLRDFADEVPGYLHNHRLCAALMDLQIKAGLPALGENMLMCYERLIQLDLIGQAELPLLQAWLADLRAAGIEA